MNCSQLLSLQLANQLQVEHSQLSNLQDTNKQDINVNSSTSKMPDIITVSLLPPMPENISPLPTLSSLDSIMPEDIMMPSV